MPNDSLGSRGSLVLGLQKLSSTLLKDEMRSDGAKTNEINAWYPYGPIRPAYFLGAVKAPSFLSNSLLGSERRGKLSSFF
jgi:hypothetical protein